MLVGQSGNKSLNSVSVSEQMLLLEYIIYILKSSGVYGNKDINVNFLSSDSSSLCVRLLDDSMKTAEYINSSYDAQISILFVSRELNTSSNKYNRIASIDNVNKLGMFIDSLESFFDTGVEVSNSGIKCFASWYKDVKGSDYLGGITIEGFSQTTQAGLVFRDSSGVEDNGATFILKYNNSL